MHFSADKRNHPNKQTPRHLAVLSLDTSAGFSCPHSVNQFPASFLVPSRPSPFAICRCSYLPSPRHAPLTPSQYLVREKEIDYLIELSKCKKHPQTLRPWPLSHLPIHPAFSVFPPGSSPFVRVCHGLSVLFLSPASTLPPFSSSGGPLRVRGRPRNRIPRVTMPLV